MKLKAYVPDPYPVEDIYHCCRWCRWFDHDCCTNPTYEGNAVDFAFDLAEDGYLRDTVVEAVNNLPNEVEMLCNSLESLIQDWGVSQKRRKQFRDFFMESLHTFLDPHLSEEVTESVASLIINRSDNAAALGTYIKNPDTFYCKEFD